MMSLTQSVDTYDKYDLKVFILMISETQKCWQ